MPNKDKIHMACAVSITKVTACCGVCQADLYDPEDGSIHIQAGDLAVNEKTLRCTNCKSLNRLPAWVMRNV